MTTRPPIRTLFAANLKVLRLRGQQTQEQVAERLGVKRSSYSGYENGTSEPPIEVLARIQDFHEVGLDVLLTTDLGALTQYEMRRMLGMGQPRAPLAKPVITEI